MADSGSTLHFDTNHFNHIFWTTPAELREKLKNRILRVIGEGREAHRIPKRVSKKWSHNTCTQEWGMK